VGELSLTACLRQAQADIPAAQADSTVDSVRLSYDGFRKVLLQRNELAECKQLQAISAKKLRLMEMRVDLKNVQITAFQSIRDTQEADIKKLKRLVWKKNFQLSGLGLLAAVLGYKVVF